MSPRFQEDTHPRVLKDFLGGYLPSLSINYVAMSKDMEKRLPQLYYIKMKISFDLGFITYVQKCMQWRKWRNWRKIASRWRFELDAKSGPLQAGDFGEIGDFGKNRQRAGDMWQNIQIGCQKWPLQSR